MNYENYMGAGCKAVLWIAYSNQNYFLIVQAYICLEFEELFLITFFKNTLWESHYPVIVNNQMNLHQVKRKTSNTLVNNFNCFLSAITIYEIADNREIAMGKIVSGNVTIVIRSLFLVGESD